MLETGILCSNFAAHLVYCAGAFLALGSGLPLLECLVHSCRLSLLLFGVSTGDHLLFGVLLTSFQKSWSLPCLSWEPTLNSWSEYTAVVL